MNKKYICILFILIFYSCELKLLEEPETPSWYLPITIPLIDTEYGFEGILQEGIITSTAEEFEDCGSDNDCDIIDENGTQGNGQWDAGESFIDENGNDIWDEYGASDSLFNMIQMEFNSEFDSIGLDVVEEQLGMSFFKVDLSSITIPPTTIQEETTYDLGENIPNPLMEPTVIPVEIEIPESENDLINTILESCPDFIPNNEQVLSIPVDLTEFPDPIELATEEISEPIIVKVPLDIDMDAIDLGDLGEITVEKIILSESMEWEVEFRNGLPFIIESLNFNIYKGPIINDNKLTSLIITDIAAYEDVSEFVNFESYELTLDENLFAEIIINVDSEQLSPEECDLNVCISDAISIDEESGSLIVDENGFTIYESTETCSNNCNPCFGEDIYVCVADAVDESGNIAGDPTIYQGAGSQGTCEASCDPCLDFTVAVCVADAVDEFGDIVGDSTIYQGADSQATCEASCEPCFDLTTSVCVADAVDENGNVIGDPTIYQGAGSQVTCEASCDPCLEQVIYICPIDSLTYNVENDCNDNCAIDCISVSIYACTTDALDEDGTVNTDLIQTYGTNGECIASCDPCFVEPIHACTTDALNDDGDVDTDLIQIYDTNGDCIASCDPCFVEPIYACTTDALDEDGNVSDEDLDEDGIPDAITIYNTSEDCALSCDSCFNASIYVCTTDSSVIDGDDGTEPTQYSSNTECIASGCASCLIESLSGWQIQDDEITFNLDGELILDTLVINLEINETPDTEPISVEFPSFDQVQIREALIDDGSYFDDFGLDGEDGSEDEGENDDIAQEYETQYSNEFILNINNGFFGEANLELTFSNIYENDAIYTESILVESETTLNDTFNLSNKRIGDKDDGNNLENIEIDYDFSIEDGQYRIPLTDNILSIGETGYSADVSNMKLLSISAITEEINFPQVQSVPLQDIPAGFDDFKLYDIFMDMNIYNQITINTVNAAFNLTGKRCPQGMDTDTCFSDEDIEGKTFPFNIVLDSPNRRIDNPCGYEVGDIAVTRISINKDSQITRYYCSEEDTNPYEETEEPFDGEENVNLLDFIYFGPNQMNMVGSVLIDGEGTLRENDNLWGDFAIAAPLAFIFNEDLIIIPQDITTINAMDETLSNQIDSALVEAEFNAEITNNSAFGMSMSMLISDSTVFPLYLDNLDNLEPHCSNETYIDEGNCVNNEFTWLNYQDSISDLGINNILFENIDSSDDRAYYVEFLGQDISGEDSLLFWIGRVIDISFIPPLETDENGFVTVPSVSFSTEVLDATRVSWITANEERYMVPMITLANTNGEPSSLQTTNYLGVRSFLTFILDTEGLSRKNKKLVTDEQSSPNINQ